MTRTYDSIKLCIKKNVIEIRTPGAFTKEAIKKVLGSRWWGTPFFFWTVPATPSAAYSLLFHLNSANFKYQYEGQEISDLAEEFKVRKEVQKIKRTNDLPLPEHCKTTPWNHQLRAYHFAKNLSSCMLALDMGTGKTKVSIDLIMNHNNGENVRALIICPKYVMDVWPDELKIHAPLKYICCAPNERIVAKRVEKIQQQEKLAGAMYCHFIAVVNYDSLLSGPMEKYILKNKWDIIFCDESHRMKSPQGKQARFIRTRLAENANKRICLTGTPAPHSPLDFWSQYFFLDCGIYGTSFPQFRNRYSVCNQYNQPYDWINQEEMNKKFYSIAYRVTAKEVLDLPEKQYIERSVDFEPSARKIYNELKKEFIADLDSGVITAANAAVKTIRLRQMTSGFAPVDESDRIEIVSTAKKDLLKDILLDFDIKEPIIIFCKYRHDLDTIIEVVKSQKRSFSEVSGRMKNSKDLKEWKDGNRDVLVAQIKAGSLGINATRSRFVIYFSMTFNAGDYGQSERRVWRPGQEKKVTYIHLKVKNTIDQYIHDSVVKKEQVVINLLDLRKHLTEF